jgi:cytochrome oxidase Cu insertion factor (SCO1/SenC/PrrC family)
MRAHVMALSLMLLATALSGCLHSHDDEQHDFHGKEYDPASKAPDFTLINQHGDSVSLSDFEGKVVVLAFTYTYCPDVCLAIEANLNTVQNEFAENEDLVIISITIDPARDTPEHLLQWTEERGYTWTHLTSDNPEDFENDDKTGVWDAYHLQVDNDHIYSDHSDHGDDNDSHSDHDGHDGHGDDNHSDHGDDNGNHSDHDDHGDDNGGGEVADEDEVYEVGHNTVTFIIDSDGNKRIVHTGSDWNTADFIEDLEYLLGMESHNDGYHL